MKIQEFDYSVDILQSILWQYNEAVNLISLLSQKQAWYTVNQSNFWDNWFNDVFNLQTANFFGLSVWSYILDLPLLVPLNPEPNTKPIWGFNAYAPSFPTLLNSYFNFGNGNFSTKGQAVILTLAEQRFILRLRYYQLISNGATYTNPNEVALNPQTIPSINKFLNYLLSTSDIDPIGNITVLDGLDMTMTYVFDFDVSDELRFVLTHFDLLPRPAAVGIKYIVLSETVFGFGIFNQNFGNGNFITPFI